MLLDWVSWLAGSESGQVQPAVFTSVLGIRASAAGHSYLFIPSMSWNSPLKTSGAGALQSALVIRMSVSRGTRVSFL